MYLLSGLLTNRGLLFKWIVNSHISRLLIYTNEFFLMSLKHDDMITGVRPYCNLLVLVFLYKLIVNSHIIFHYQCMYTNTIYIMSLENNDRITGADWLVLAKAFRNSLGNNIICSNQLYTAIYHNYFVLMCSNENYIRDVFYW